MVKCRVGLGLGQALPNPIKRNLKPDLKKTQTLFSQPDPNWTNIGSDPTRIGPTSGRAQPDPTEIVNPTIQFSFLTTISTNSAITQPFQTQFNSTFHNHFNQFHNYFNPSHKSIPKSNMKNTQCN